MVTARGSPYGTATTMILTETIKASTRWCKNVRENRASTKSSYLVKPLIRWPSIHINVAKAAYIPTFPICSAKTDNFIWRGV